MESKRWTRIVPCTPFCIVNPIKMSKTKYRMCVKQIQSFCWSCCTYSLRYKKKSPYPKYFALPKSIKRQKTKQNMQTPEYIKNLLWMYNHNSFSPFNIKKDTYFNESLFFSYRRSVHKGHNSSGRLINIISIT